MKALIVYDSMFGNTRQIARAIGDTLADRFAVQVIPVAEASPLPADTDLLVVGGPTQGHGASPGMKALLASVERGALQDVPTATFDTRFQMPRWLTGSAAGVIANGLRQAGCVMVAPPESFFVKRGKEGPLLPGELERAHEWAGTMMAAVPTAADQPVYR
jgi:flavodoxin